MSAHQHSVRVTDAKFIIGATSALSLGWLLFEPFLLTATGLDEYDHDSVRKCVVRMLQLMVDRADADPAIPSQTNGGGGSGRSAIPKAIISRHGC
jgi:hypothetical protein